MNVLDTADFADSKRATDIREAEVNIVERAIGTFREIDDVAVGSIDAAVSGLEVEDTTDSTIGVERQALDPVLGIVGEEVAALIATRELAAVIDEPAGNRRIASVVRIGVDWIGVGRIAGCPFDIRPAIVRAPNADIHFFHRR